MDVRSGRGTLRTLTMKGNEAKLYIGRAQAGHLHSTRNETGSVNHKRTAAAWLGMICADTSLLMQHSGPLSPSLRTILQECKGKRNVWNRTSMYANVKRDNLEIFTIWNT
jgi:hypothetical protein